MSYIFENTTINKVYAQTGSFNSKSIALLRNLGFHRDGCLREHHELDGSFYDDYIYSITSSDYSKTQIKKVNLI